MLHASPCFDKLSMTKLKLVPTPCFEKLSMTMEARRPELVEGRPLPGQPGLRPRTRRVRDRRSCGWTRTKKPANAMAVSALPKAAV